MPMDLPPSTLPRETLLARYAFSQALARSTSLSALEVSLDEYLSSLATLPLALERTGKPSSSCICRTMRSCSAASARRSPSGSRDGLRTLPAPPRPEWNLLVAEVELLMVGAMGVGTPEAEVTAFGALKKLPAPLFFVCVSK